MGIYRNSSLMIKIISLWKLALKISEYMKLFLLMKMQMANKMIIFILKNVLNNIGVGCEVSTARLSVNVSSSRKIVHQVKDRERPLVNIENMVNLWCKETNRTWHGLNRSIIQAKARNLFIYFQRIWGIWRLDSLS